MGYTAASAVLRGNVVRGNGARSRATATDARGGREGGRGGEHERQAA